MSENCVFYSQTKLIIETVLRAAEDLNTRSGNVPPETCDARTDFDRILDMLAQEATRKITAVFFHLLAAPQSENQTLKAKVCQLEKTLKTTTENYEHARVWRENVLNGCPVLVEQTGMIFTLKPFGKCVPQADEGTAGNSEPSPAAGWTCGDDAGARLLKGVHHVSPENNSQEADAPVESTSPSRQEDSSGARTAGTHSQKRPAGSQRAAIVTCPVCNKSFSRQLYLKKHMNTHREPIACDQCPRKFRNTATFEQHLLRHEEKKYATFECSQCDKTFKTKIHLKTHQVVHDDTRAFICSTCGKGFKTKPCLQAHQVVHSVEKLHKCTECGESFKYAFTLRCHQSTHTGDYPYKCTECDKAFIKRRSLKMHQAVHRGKMFTCETCGAGFTLQHNLKRHIRIHTGEKPFTCKICGKSFVQNKLKEHMLLHGASKPFMCDVCGKTFLYNCHLRKHQKLAHKDLSRKGERRSHERTNRRVIYRQDRTTVEVTPFSCKTCHKGFITASSLKRHEQLHTGKLRYTCNTCGKSFLHKNTFDYHQRIHSGERPFACDLCGERFIISHALKSHKRKHTGEKPYQCEQCDKAFRVYTNYRRHLRIHTGEKPYECEVCGMKFRQLVHVKFHMQVHTGVKPYACSACGLRFSDSRLLKRHSCTGKVNASEDASLMSFT